LAVKRKKEPKAAIWYLKGRCAVEVFSKEKLYGV